MQSAKDSYRLLSYAFIHADYLHLLVNMFVLYNFGSNGTELMYNLYFGTKGTLWYVLLYLGGAITAVIPAYEKNKSNYSYSAVGASGAVSAVVFAYILFSPLQSFYILFIPFPIPAYIFGILFLGISYYLAKQNKGNIGHDAHFFGAIFGLFFTVILNKDILFNFLEILKNKWFQ